MFMTVCLKLILRAKFVRYFKKPFFYEFFIKNKYVIINNKSTFTILSIRE